MRAGSHQLPRLMRLLSWNVNGRVGASCRRQAAAVMSRQPDIIALQEVTLTSHEQWRHELLASAYSVLSTVDLVQLPYPPVKPPIQRKYFNLIAARSLIAALPGLRYADPDQARVAFPEKYVAARITVDGAPVDVHNAHLPPGSSRGTIKLHAFHAIRRRIDQPTACPRILCGDFNTPQAEDAGGLTTWASAHPSLREQWDTAERLVLEHPTMRDVYREQHQRGDPFAASHFTRGTPRRYDHVYASPELRALSCRYLTDCLDRRLSDHAPVEAELVVQT
jgi:endonuclease/exonuclease/phosphatase family metal-dependent hydrolase